MPNGKSRGNALHGSEVVLFSEPRIIKGSAETLPTPYRCIAVLLGSDGVGHGCGVVTRIHRTEVFQGVANGNLGVVLTLVVR